MSNQQVPAVVPQRGREGFLLQGGEIVNTVEKVSSQGKTFYVNRVMYWALDEPKLIQITTFKSALTTEMLSEGVHISSFRVFNNEVNITLVEKSDPFEEE